MKKNSDVKFFFEKQKTKDETLTFCESYKSKTMNSNDNKRK